MSAVAANPKIIDLINAKEKDSKPRVSIEFFPPRTDVGVKVSLFINEKSIIVYTCSCNWYVISSSYYSYQRSFLQFKKYI